MLKIENGKLRGSNYAFALPEGFTFSVKPYAFGAEQLIFTNDYGVIITIKFRDKCAFLRKYGIVDYDDSTIKRGDFISVKRGEGTGISLFYWDEDFKAEIYEEIYDFEESKAQETQLRIYIRLFTRHRNDRQALQEVLAQPTIKAFLDSIEYY